MTAPLSPTPEPIPGWVLVRRAIEPEFTAVRERVERAPLGVGVAAPALTDEQFAAWLKQQTTMIETASALLTEAAAKISAAANAFDETHDEPAVVRACDEFNRRLRAIAEWAEVAWRTTPPPDFQGSFAAMREIPGRIIREMGKYLDAVIAGAEGRVIGRVEVNIDIQRLIDAAARSGMSELSRGRPFPTGCALTIAGAVLLVALAMCAG